MGRIADDAGRGAALIPTAVLAPFAFVWGAVWGSFVNVVIERWPRGMSVLRPGSQCLSCGKPVAFYDNIPIVSYFVLRGRCRACGAAFSARHAGVEATLALFSMSLAVRHYAPGVELAPAAAGFLVDFGFAAALVAIAFIDLDTGYIPNVITLPSLAVGLSAAAILPGRDFLDSAIAAVAGYLLVEVFFIRLYRLLRGIQGMWPGDAKLLAMLGAFLGVRGALVALFAGALQGAIVGGLAARKAALGGKLRDGEPIGKVRVPFGPYLALGAVEFLLFGDEILSVYQSLGSSEAW